jgi:hypothetical protein
MNNRGLSTLLVLALTLQSAAPAVAAIGRVRVAAPKTNVSVVPGGVTQAHLGNLSPASLSNLSLNGSLSGVLPNTPAAVAPTALQARTSLSPAQSAALPAVAINPGAATAAAASALNPQAAAQQQKDSTAATLHSTAKGMREVAKPNASLGTGYSVGNHMYHNAGEKTSAAADVRGRLAAATPLQMGLQHSKPNIEPTFSPPRADASLPLEQLEETEAIEQEEGLRLSFPQSVKNQLTTGNPAKGISGAMKLVRPFKGSKKYWADFRKGQDVQIVIGGEKVFVTKITRAVNKKISQLSRADFKHMMPDYKLKAGVRELRAALIDQLENKRKMWQPSDPPISGNSTVRVVEFRSFKDVYQDKHGKDADVSTPAPVERNPLVIKPEGKLARLAYLMPRAVFIDFDMFEGPVSREVLLDIAKMQRSGAYFVAFSRKPYEELGGMRDNMIRQMNDYQLGSLMTYRFLAVTDDGAVISAFPRDGIMKPVKIAEITSGEIDVLNDAARRAAAAAGISPRSIRRVEQPSIYTHQDAEGRFARKPRFVKDTQVRFEIEFTRAVNDEQRAAWQEAFDGFLAAHSMELHRKSYEAENGRQRLVLQKTTLAGSMESLQEALRETFQLYLNPGDYLVLSNDKDVLAANPEVLDVAGESGLEGEALVENTLGLILGDYRQDMDLDRVGSASRMISFTKYRERYMADMVVDEQRSEQNINFFSGHMVHSTNDWLIWNLRNGRRPTAEEYEAHMRKMWQAGLTEEKPVRVPDGDTMEGWLNSSVIRALKMREIVLKIHDRGEMIVGSEIPRQLIVRDYHRKRGHVGELKGRYITNAIIDLLVYRPNPDKPGHGTIVAYDYKSGPAKSVEKLEEDPQVLIYALLAQENWVGKTFSVPYMVGGEEVTIDDFSVEFIYSPLKQTPHINRWMLEEIRLKIIRVYERMYRATAELLGEIPQKAVSRSLKGNPKRGLPKNVPGLRLAPEDARKIATGKAKSIVRKQSALPRAYVAIIETSPEAGVGNQVIGFARIHRVQPLKDGSFRWFFSNVTPIKTPYPAPNVRGGGSWSKSVPVQGARILKAEKKKAKKKKKS